MRCDQTSEHFVNTHTASDLGIFEQELQYEERKKKLLEVDGRKEDRNPETYIIRSIFCERI